MPPVILAEAQGNLPPDRIETLAYDKAADTNEVHELFSSQDIKAVIQNRELWREEPSEQPSNRQRLRPARRRISLPISHKAWHG